MSKQLNFFPYMGGKHYLLNSIYKLLDTSKSCFIDLFGGSGKVILNLSPNTYKNRIYNDIDSNLYNLFFQIKNHPEEFIKAVDLPRSEQLYNEFRLKLKNNSFKDDLNRAVTFYYYKCNSFNGKDGFAYSFVRNHANSFCTRLNELNTIKNIIQHITIFHRDYRRILKSINGKKDIMLYCDPPYFNCEFYYPNSNFKIEDHSILASELNNLSCSIMVSYYYFDDIENLYPKNKWTYFEIEKVKNSFGITKNFHSTEKKRPRSKELLICNYNINY